MQLNKIKREREESVMGSVAQTNFLISKNINQGVQSQSYFWQVTFLKLNCNSARKECKESLGATKKRHAGKVKIDQFHVPKLGAFVSFSELKKNN